MGIIERFDMNFQEINIYCDESCHLQNDKQKVMVWGGVICPQNKAKEVFRRIREIKNKHNLKNKYDKNYRFEMKWTKISSSKLDFYLDIIDYFFDNSDLSFRGLLVPNKDILNFKNDAEFDEFYYKMYYTMLKTVFKPDNKYNIYLDVKDTRGSQKIYKLEQCLENTLSQQYSFRGKIINRIQEVKSHQVELVQLSDLLIGAISYVNRQKEGSNAKKKIIARINERGYVLSKSTLLREEKFNLFRWHGER